MLLRKYWFQISGVRPKKVSGVRCQANFRGSDISRAGLCARRFQIIAYYKIWSAQPATSSAESRPTLLICAVPDT